MARSDPYFLPPRTPRNGKVKKAAANGTTAELGRASNRRLPKGSGGNLLRKVAGKVIAARRVSAAPKVAADRASAADPVDEESRGAARLSIADAVLVDDPQASQDGEGGDRRVTDFNAMNALGSLALNEPQVEASPAPQRPEGDGETQHATMMAKVFNQVLGTEKNPDDGKEMTFGGYHDCVGRRSRAGA